MSKRGARKTIVKISSMVSDRIEGGFLFLVHLTEFTNTSGKSVLSYHFRNPTSGHTMSVFQK